MMTRKDYVKIAKAISNVPNSDANETIWKNAVVDELCTIFKDDNPNFNPSIFRDACKEEMR